MQNKLSKVAFKDVSWKPLQWIAYSTCKLSTRTKSINLEEGTEVTEVLLIERAYAGKISKLNT